MFGHRPSHRDRASLRIAALVYLGRSLAALATLGLAGLAAWEQEMRFLHGAAVGLVIWLILSLLNAFGETRCALCRGSLFHATGSVKHARARRLLGSYQLNTALQALFSTSYRCQHCGTRIDCRGDSAAIPGRPPSPGQPTGSHLSQPRAVNPGIVLQVKSPPKRRRRRR